MIVVRSSLPDMPAASMPWLTASEAVRMDALLAEW